MGQPSLGMRLTSERIRAMRTKTKSRRAKYEALESRYLMASDWQNSVNALDVDASGLVTSLDALLVLNDLNANGVRNLGSRPVGSVEPKCDTTGDNLLTPQDALLVLNALNRFVAPHSVAVDLVESSDPNGNDVVLQPVIQFTGSTSPEARIKIEQLNAVGTPLTSTVVANEQGLYSATLNLIERTTHLRFTSTDALGRTATTEREILLGDASVDWNATLLNLVREATSTLDTGTLLKPPPPLVARNLAMIHAAMFDAVNTIDKAYEPYAVNLPQVANASPVAALTTAAFGVAKSLFPGTQALREIQATLEESMATVPDGEAKALGIEIGQQVATAILNLRANDGSQLTSLYAPGTDPGDWSPTFPDFLPPTLPQWPSVTPFAMDVSSQFRPDAPPALDSAEYASAVDQVMRLGAIDSTERTTQQTEIAKFWADGGGTATPPGHWNRIATDALLTMDQSLVKNARVYALLNLALADAGIVSWDAKYHFDLWRPIDAIREADTDGNALTQRVPGWTPLLTTPSFPTYTSGHSTFSGAAATVLSALLGDNLAFTTRADPGSAGAWPPADDISQLKTRTFENFWAAAEEAGMSRIYGGIHFSFDNEAGLNSGSQVGDLVASSLLLSKSEIGQRIASQRMPLVGEVAPSVSLLNQYAQNIQVNSYIGSKAVVLYFYPKDDTPGCTEQAKAFRDRITDIRAMGAEVFGISLDDVDSHRAFSDKFQLNFDLLADSTHVVAEAYGVLSEINDSLIAKRTTFIIGVDGKIAKVFENVQVANHGDEIIAALQELS